MNRLGTLHGGGQKLLEVVKARARSWLPPRCQLTFESEKGLDLAQAREDMGGLQGELAIVSAAVRPVYQGQVGAM